MAFKLIKRRPVIKALCVCDAKSKYDEYLSMKIIMSVLNILFLLGTLIWPLIILGRTKLFETFGSMESITILILLFALFTYPLPAIIGNLLFWKKKKIDPKLKLFLYTVISGLGYLVITGIFIYIEYFCNGKVYCNYKVLVQ